MCFSYHSILPSQQGFYTDSTLSQWPSEPAWGCIYWSKLIMFQNNTVPNQETVIYTWQQYLSNDIGSDLFQFSMCVCVWGGSIPEGSGNFAGHAMRIKLWVHSECVWDPGLWGCGEPRGMGHLLLFIYLFDRAAEICSFMWRGLQRYIYLKDDVLVWYFRFWCSLLLASHFIRAERAGLRWGVS